MRTITNDCSTVRKAKLKLFPFLISLACVCISTTVFAQSLTFPTSCPSKDLEIVSAALTGGDACNTCTPNTTVTRNLTLGINNKTGSTRTSFAFWATLEITHANGTVVTTSIARCSGPIPPTGPLPAVYTGGNFGTIQYTCGDALRLVDLHLAWTDAANNAKNECTYVLSHPQDIAPKCGTQPSIQINAGVNGSATKSNATCTGGDGSIDLTPFGGTPNVAPAAPYTYSWSASNGGIVPNGQSTNQDLTGLVPGTYTCRITDKNGCYFDKIVAVDGPPALPTPAGSVTQQPTCTTATGVVSVTSPDANTTYTLWQNGSAVYTANSSGVFGAVATGTYSLHAAQGQCSQTGNNVTVNAQPVSPTFTVCIVQPTLCATGSLTITASNGSDFRYSIDDGANYLNNGGVFTGLKTGDVTKVKVKNGAGCFSNAVACSSLTSSCGGGITQKTSPTQLTALSEQNLEVKAYPNPFNDRVKFLVNVQQAGNGSLEVYNSLGQKVKTVFQGHMNAGNQSFDLRLPKTQFSTLIYVLRVGDKKVTGKLLQMNQ